MAVAVYRITENQFYRLLEDRETYRILELIAQSVPIITPPGVGDITKTWMPQLGYAGGLVLLSIAALNCPSDAPETLPAPSGASAPISLWLPYIPLAIAGGSCSLTAVTVAASSGSYAGAGPMRAASDAMVLLRRRCGRRRPAGSRRGRRRHRQSRGR